MTGLIRGLVERDLQLLDYDAWRRAGLTLNSLSATGRAITPATALQSVAVFACVRVLTETIASLPLITYRRLQPRGKQRDLANPLYPVLHDLPNPEMTSAELRETIVGHLELRGNAYLNIVRDAGGRVRELWPLRPDMMTVARSQSGALTYTYCVQGQDVPIPYDAVCHIRGLSNDGIHGYSPIALAREAVGLSQAAEEYGARWFSGGARPSGVLQVSGRLSQEAADRLRDSWNTAHGGLDRAQRVAVLEEGVTWQAIGVPPEDAQFLETRKFQTVEIARLFRVPPHMIQDLERATFTNIEHQSLDFVVHTLRPRLVRIEQAFGRDLFGVPSESFCEFLVDGLLRGDLASRYTAYATARNWGFLSANDIREIENMNPIPDGDIYLQPLNMVPAGQQPEPPAPPADPAQRSLPEARATGGGSASARDRLAQRYETLFLDISRRIVNREVAEVRRAADRHLNRRDLVSFKNWLRDYYANFPETATRTALPLMQTYAEAILEDAAAEIGSDDPMAAEMAQQIQEYADGFGASWGARSQAQLEQQADLADESGGDPYVSVTTRLDEWAQKRPSKVAATEVIRLMGAMVVARWVAGGIRRIIWEKHGKGCGFCNKLNGKTFSIEHPIVSKGSEVEGDAATGNFKAKRDYRHPPIHLACRCGLRAIVEGR